MILGLLLVPIETRAGLFTSQFSDFKKLVERGQDEAAERLLLKEANYFGKLDGDKQALVEDFRQKRLIEKFLSLQKSGDSRAALALSVKFRPQFESLTGERRQQYLTSLADVEANECVRLAEIEDALLQASAVTARRERWQQLRSGLSDARTALVAVNVDFRSGCKNVVAGRLDRLTREITTQLTSSAAQEFAAYGVFAQPSFLLEYPIDLTITQIVPDVPTMSPLVEGAPSASLQRFRDLYGKGLNATQHSYLTRLYYAERLKERSAPSYADKQRIIREMQQVGWEPGPLGRNILVAAWPIAQSATAQAVVEEPTRFEFRRLPNEVTPANLLQGADSGRDLIILFRYGPVESQRNTQSSMISSRYETGTRSIVNPAYANAEDELREAQRQMREVQKTAENTTISGNSRYDLLAGTISAATEIAAENRLRRAETSLQEIPPTMIETLYSTYTYRQDTVKVSQSSTVAYLVIDPGAGTTKSGELLRESNQSFTVLDGVHPLDPDHERLVAGSKTLDAIRRFESMNFVDRYDTLIEKVLTQYEQGS